jgi:MFS family permease
MGRALAHRNYRLFFAGQAVSLIGTWMTRVATGWLVYRLAGKGTNAALLLGLVSFVGQSPSFFLTPFTGVLVDRWDRRRLLLVTQALFAVQSALMTGVAFLAPPAGAPAGDAWLFLAVITGLSLLNGVVNAFDMPARQAFLVEMVVQREDLPNAIALNSSLVNGGRLVGPSVAGLLIAAAGEAWCFLTDAVSYLAVIAALLAMHVAARALPTRRVSVWQGLREGARYVFGFAPIRSVLLLLALVSLTGMPFLVLMPVFAEMLGGGARSLGFLNGAAGVGALSGALYLASRRTVLGLGRAIVWAATLFGASLIGFGLSRHLWLSLALMLTTGFGMMVHMAASNTILQTIAEEDKRGRVMSFYSLAFLGMTPFGSLLAGLLAEWVGAPWTVLGGGVACLVGAALFAARLPGLRALVRPIYVERGILPAAASGVQSASEVALPPQG